MTCETKKKVFFIDIEEKLYKKLKSLKQILLM